MPVNNPLLENWNTPFETPPFHLITPGHFRPAADIAIREALEEADIIAQNPEPPTFENTVAALDRSGYRLNRLATILFNLNSAETSKEIQEAARELSPLLTRLSNDITMNKDLFIRIKAVYEGMDKAGLTTEQKMLTRKKYRSFMLGGAGLDEKEKDRFRALSEELAGLALKFEENVLEETNAFELHLTSEAELEGLPQGIREAAAAEAIRRGKEGWVFTLNAPSYVPFMQYSLKRDLREKMYRAYSSRAFNNNERDNRKHINTIINLRLEMARLPGFNSYAEMTLGDRMADSVEKVYSFLDDLYKASLPAAERDFSNVKEFALTSGLTDFSRWDWAFYSEKLKKARYDIDDEILRPYFSLESVRDAVFSLAGKLFGLSFKSNKSIPVYHNEVSTWEVYGKNDRFMAILFLDFHPRPGKNGGAWMTSYREQSIHNGSDIRPLVSLVTNFTRPTSSRPSLLTFSELTTLLHEFGHALHGMLSDCTYESISGTNVARDFVELPSQFMENWAFENIWLDSWASHYETGEKIPHEIIKKIRDASTFNEGYACQRQLGFGLLDMAYHTITEPSDTSPSEFEITVTAKTDPFQPVENTCFSTAFTHIFGGGYAAGYYGYKWAEVLDADAFSFFRENGLFNPETAASFMENILAKGGSDNPMNLYVRFRGREPSQDAFLERSGLKVPDDQDD